MDLHQVARGLWRWVLPHPEWEPPEQEDSPADWPAEVGCVAYETPDTLVLIDPLVVNGEQAALDEHAAAKERVAILLTVKWHERSRAELTKRYDASAKVPEGVEAFEIPGAGETIFWIPGDRPPGLRMCPESWLRHLGGYTQEDLRADLQPLLDLPVEMVLVSHGEPVLHGGRAALERALA